MDGLLNAGPATHWAQRHKTLKRIQNRQNWMQNDCKETQNVYKEMYNDHKENKMTKKDYL